MAAKGAKRKNNSLPFFCALIDIIPTLTMVKSKMVMAAGLSFFDKEASLVSLLPPIQSTKISNIAQGIISPLFDKRSSQYLSPGSNELAMRKNLLPKFDTLRHY